MKKIAVVTLSLMLAACGSDSDDNDGGISFNGNTSPANVDASNAKQIGETAGESIEKAAGSTNVPTLPGGIALDSNINIQEINTIIIDMVKQPVLPAGVDVSDEQCSSGSASIEVPFDFSGPSSSTVTYNDCTLIDSDLTFTGKATVRFEDFGNNNAGFTVRFSNFLISRPGFDDVTLNIFLDCSNEFTCTYNSDFTGSDGNIHRVSDMSFTGNANDGYNGTATFYHASYGATTITATNITYGACGNLPDGGSIEFNSANNSSGNITFSANCSTTGSWTSGDLAGSF